MKGASYLWRITQAHEIVLRALAVSITKGDLEKDSKEYQLLELFIKISDKKEKGAKEKWRNYQNIDGKKDK